MIDLKDCSAEAMSVAVNFMYGFSKRMGSSCTSLSPS